MFLFIISCMWTRGDNILHNLWTWYFFYELMFPKNGLMSKWINSFWHNNKCVNFICKQLKMTYLIFCVKVDLPILTHTYLTHITYQFGLCLLCVNNDHKGFELLIVVALNGRVFWWIPMMAAKLLTWGWFWIGEFHRWHVSHLSWARERDVEDLTMIIASNCFN